MLSLPRAWLQSLLGELRSPKLHLQGKKKKKKVTPPLLSVIWVQHVILSIPQCQVK